MLNATTREYPTHKPYQDRTRRNQENGRLAQNPDQPTTFIEVQQYLDFTYGASSVDITLPNNARARLVVAANGRVYLQVPVNS